MKIVAGITATGNLTLGNYIGSIKNLVKKQEDNDVYAFVADLHALTIKIDPDVLRQNVINISKLYLASGIDTNKTKLFVQSKVTGHEELMYLLLVNTSIGELSRMTQFKDKTVKADNGTETVPTGLLTYPVLMAADILLHNAEGVVVGDDQKQHLELARNIVERMNNRYGTEMKLPQTLTGDIGHRIMALKNPENKMSKTDIDSNNTIFLLDDEATVVSKIKAAVTDSENKVYFDKKNKPGVSNLITIFAALSDKTIEDASEELKDLNYGEFKEVVSTKINETLIPLQEKFSKISDEQITEELNKNLEAVKNDAKKIVNDIKRKMGL
ncbi:MAG: tryptophan--tRNA ligase [Tenericutes bacterium]|nr:MAG: tryptophan--tRNA ligase [Mycoplasmatota bacterium]